MSEPASSDLPLFYSAVEPLDKERHASLGLASNRSNFSFASKASAVPLNTPEFNFALKNFPIVFTSTTDPQPIAVLGLQREQNLFVNPDGTWQLGAYVPIYVRRYPFIFGALETDDQYALCVDSAADMVSNSPDQPFFKDGELTETAQKGVETCQVFQQQHAATKKVMEKLAASGLLEQREATVNLKGTTKVLSSYIGVSEERLGTLSDEQFLELRHNDLLPFVYMHLASLSNWMRLLDLHIARNPLPEAAASNGGTVFPAGP